MRRESLGHHGQFRAFRSTLVAASTGPLSPLPRRNGREINPQTFLGLSPLVPLRHADDPSPSPGNRQDGPRQNRLPIPTETGTCSQPIEPSCLMQEGSQSYDRLQFCDRHHSFSDRIDHHRVILIVHFRLNPITQLDVFHHLGGFVDMQTHFLTVPPLTT